MTIRTKKIIKNTINILAPIPKKFNLLYSKKIYKTQVFLLFYYIIHKLIFLL